MQVQKLLKPVAVAAVLSALALSAQADTTYNATVMPAGSNLFGFGVTYDNFALTTVGTVELGLRARYRVRPTQASDASGNYGPFDAGTQTAAFGSPARDDRAEWSYDFYLKDALAPSGNAYSLCVDGQCINPLTFGDNAGSLATGLGNSMQLFFAGTPGNVGYNVNAAGVHTFSLSVSDANGVLLGSSVITATVVAVPEPETYAMLAAGLGVLGFLARRRRKN